MTVTVGPDGGAGLLELDECAAVVLGAVCVLWCVAGVLEWSAVVAAAVVEAVRDFEEWCLAGVADVLALADAEPDHVPAMPVGIGDELLLSALPLLPPQAAASSETASNATPARIRMPRSYHGY